MFGASARLAAMLTLSALASAADAEGLYRTTLIVTGQRDATRAPAVAEAFKEVLAKVSGDQRLLADPRAAKLAAAEAEAAVRAVRYRDRLEHLPVHDEQGTRDRPHDLTVGFVPERIDAALRELGRRPWLTPRPRVAVFVTWANGTETGVLSADGERGAARREALDAAAERVGMPVALPVEAALAAAGLSVERLPATGLAELDALARTVNGDRALVGTMVFDDEHHGWTTEWRLALYSETQLWRVRGVNFDEAFRNGLRGAAQLLSGQGIPNEP